jgi:hypothetical protein
MVTQRQSYGSIILRLLWGDTIEACDTRDMAWDELLHVAARNGVLIRAVEKLHAIGLESPHFLYSAAKETRDRNQKKLALITRIAKSCIDARIEFIFPNVLQNYPDMGSDIDLYVAAHTAEVDGAIVSGLNATQGKRSLRNRIDGTATYRLAGCDFLLDIHHGRVGLLGEHKFVSQMIGNGRLAKIDGNVLLIPSPEDQLILQTQKVVQRSYLRLSDLVATIRLFRENTLEWNYILKTARKLGVSYDLGCYLKFVDQIHCEAFRHTLLPDSLKSFPGSKRMTSIEFKDGFYRYPRLRIGSRCYANKFWSAVRSEDWKVASRLSLLPLIAVPRIIRRLRIS